MAVVGVTHSKVVTVPDDGVSPVGSDEWNAGHVITGLENVDNTSDVNKPVSTAQQAAINAGVASVTKTSIGLGNVDNTSDANKPLSTADIAALALKAPLASPALTGVPTAPTAAALTNNTQLATTAYADIADALKARLAGTNTFTGAQTITDATVSSSAVTGALIVTGGVGIGGAVNATGAIAATGGFTSPATNQSFGPGGVGAASNAQVILNASSAANSGASVSFRRNSVALFAFGNSSGILGGTSNDFVIYSNTTGAGVTAAVNVSDATGAVTVQSDFGTTNPATKTTNYTLLATDNSLIFNGAASITLTLPAASSFPGRHLWLKNIAAFTVVSASANVVPQAGGAATAAILAATAGKWAFLQSDGSNWQIMASN